MPHIQNPPAELVSVATCTLKAVYKHHHRGQCNVVFIQRWSLYAGSVTCLYMQAVFRADLAVCAIISQHIVLVLGHSILDALGFGGY